MIDSDEPPAPRGGLEVPLGLALLAFGLLLVAVPRYGWFRDELYYLACAQRLAWGYVDHPPFSIAVLAAVRAVLGDSLWAVRLVPALAIAATAFLTGALARRLGAGRAGQALAALAAGCAPLYLSIGHIYSMNAFEPPLWTLSAWLLIDALERRRTRDWALLGVALGLALLNKLGTLWWGAGLAAGLLVSRERRALATPGPWIAAAVALALFVPHVAWQIANDWPTVEFMRNATGQKMVAVSPADFAIGQWLSLGPAGSPVWIVGLVALLAARRAAWMRVLGVAWLVVVAIVLAGGRSRATNVAAAYPALCAAGAVAIEAFFARRGWRAATPAAVALVGLLSAPAVPLAIPVLPVDAFIAWQRALGLAPHTDEHLELGALPQFYADMFGWEDMVETVARVWTALPPEDRAKASIYTQNYGEAGAIDRFGRGWGLPPAISGHNNYWLWGPRGGTGEVVLILGGERDDHARSFESVVAADTTSCEHCMPYERDLVVWVCRGLRRPLAEAWGRVKHYD
jgi:hypothetical protein